MKTFNHSVWRTLVELASSFLPGQTIHSIHDAEETNPASVAHSASITWWVFWEEAGLFHLVRGKLQYSEKYGKVMMTVPKQKWEGLRKGLNKQARGSALLFFPNQIYLVILPGVQTLGAGVRAAELADIFSSLSVKQLKRPSEKLFSVVFCSLTFSLEEGKWRESFPQRCHASFLLKSFLADNRWLVLRRCSFLVPDWNVHWLVSNQLF